MHLDTVANETPANLAISSMVTLAIFTPDGSLQDDDFSFSRPVFKCIERLKSLAP
jgi:hypothetical protein